MAIQRVSEDSLHDVVDNYIDDAKNGRFYREVIEIKFARGIPISVKSLIKKRRLAEFIQLDAVHFNLETLENMDYEKSD